MTPTLILLLIIAYFALLYVIARITAKDDSNESFFIGKRESPWYVVAFGMIGASLSGVTFISIPGVIGQVDALNGCFSYMQVAAGYLLGYAVIALLLMPLYYRMQLTSIYTYLEERFGTYSYKTGASFFLISRIIGASFRLFLVALVLQTFVFDPLGVPFALNVLFALALIWVYTLKGGIRTIVWTDTLQTTFMLVAVIATIYHIGSTLGLGIGGLIDAVASSEYSRIFFFDEPMAGRFFPKQFFGGMFIAIAMTGLDQDMMQKNNSCKNIGEAQLNMFTFSTVLFFVNLLFVSLGALLYIYAQQQQIALPERSDLLFPTLAFEHFSPIIGVFFWIGLIAATYSSADSALTALTTSFCIDILDMEKKEDWDEAQKKRVRYITHIAMTGVLFIVISIFYYFLQKDVVTQLFIFSTYTYGPLVGLFAFGLFVKGRTLRDHLVPFVCFAIPFVIFWLNKSVPVWSSPTGEAGDGFQFGFTLIILNALLTFAGLLMISKPVDR